MLKKIDRLVFSTFIGPFLLTLSVAVFILLLQIIMTRFHQLVGKGIELSVFGKLFFYFGLTVTPAALPLAVLLSSIMAFGTLGQHYELTAIKSTGVSLLRVLRPIGLFAALLTVLAFFFNNNVVPHANLEAFSLIWDIKKAKPSMQFEDGVFYNGLDNFSIKVEKKSGEFGEFIEDVMIYNHGNFRGNTDLITAKKGLMYTTKKNDIEFLVLELEDGYRAFDIGKDNGKKPAGEEFLRTEFEKARFLFNLEGIFGLDTTNRNSFKNHPYMKNIHQLLDGADTAYITLETGMRMDYQGLCRLYPYTFSSYNKTVQDSIAEANKRKYEDEEDLKKDQPQKKQAKTPITPNKEILKKGPVKKGPLKKEDKKEKTAPAHKVKKQNPLVVAKRKANNIRSRLESQMKSTRDKQRTSKAYRHLHEFHEKIAKAFACFIMFLIGAPLGSIIKKGGIGLPVVFSIVFFVLWFVLLNTGKKLAREMVLEPWLAAWMANLILLAFGLFFLRQAYKDARLFEVDGYTNFIKKVKAKFKRSKS